MRVKTQRFLYICYLGLGKGFLDMIQESINNIGKKNR